MLRLATPEGWWLVTHPDHARLAGDFASAWGNDLFAPPEPREHVLSAIYAHDDGWRTRDVSPSLTREGKPAAFSIDLVGKYSAFEEIDLEAYLTVRRNAVLAMAEQDAYAAILISMHTHNLLSARADRSTIRPDQLPLLDTFLGAQQQLQQDLRARLSPSEPADTLTANFRLLQATDNLSLLACVDFPGPATLLHPLLMHSGDTSEIAVQHTGQRTFRLTPNPLREPVMQFSLRARYLAGATFATGLELAEKLAAAPMQHLTVTITG